MVSSRRQYAEEQLQYAENQKALAALKSIQKKKRINAANRLLRENIKISNKSLALYSQTMTAGGRDCTDPVIHWFRRDEVAKTMIALVERHAAEHCSGMVSKGYVEYAFNGCDYLFVSSSKLNWTRSKKITKLCGYVFVKHDPTNNIAYIDVVCSANKMGRVLLDSVEDYCHNELKCKAIHLSALSHVICYYAQRGYRQTATENACEVIAPKLTGTRKGNPTDGFKMAKCLAKGKEVSNPKAFPTGCSNWYNKSR
jgi:hypothetical protein